MSKCKIQEENLNQNKYNFGLKKKKKKRWQEYTEELYKKGLNDSDNYDGVAIHLELEILQCEVKWALGSITTNKPSRGNGIPAELCKNPKR